MREIEHRRHSWRDDGPHLNQRGVDLARRVGETMGGFALVVSSDKARAIETAVAMGCAVDREEKLLGNFNSIESVAGGKPTCEGLARAYHRSSAAKKLLQTHAALLLRIAAELPEDGRALLVSHGGVIECGVVGLLPDLGYSQWGPPAERCEGALMRFDGDVCVSAEPLRLPDGWL